MKFRVICLLVLSFHLPATAGEKRVVRFDNPEKSTHSRFFAEGYDIAAYKPGHFLDLVVAPGEFESLQGMKQPPRVIKTESDLKRNLYAVQDLAPQFPGYRRYADVLAELRKMEAKHPEICRLFQIGESWGSIYSAAGFPFYDDYRHHIWALKVSDNVASEEDEPSVYFMGLHHAREVASVEMVMAILRHLVDGYGEDAACTRRIDDSQIWFIPLVNPDGHRLVMEEIDVWWRKNMRDNNQNGEFDTEGGYGDGIDGVDLNRNYAFNWGGIGSSEKWYSQLYRGPSPFSEPEPEALGDFLAARHFVAGISYHSYGEMVLHPYAYGIGAVAPDHQALWELAVGMADSIPATHGGSYLPLAGWQLYPASGTLEDYAYAAHGVFAYTIELGTEFIPPAEEIDALTEDNMQAAMMLLDRVNGSMVSGRVTDALNGHPVAAEIFVEGIDDTGGFRRPYASDPEFGRYYRLLPEGVYHIRVSANGYETATAEGVPVGRDWQTVSDALMNPAREVFSLDIKANGEDDDLTLRQGEALALLVNLRSGRYAGIPVDLWMLVESPHGWYHYVLPNGWSQGKAATYQGGLPTLKDRSVSTPPGLPPGRYTFHFGFDGRRNGLMDDPLYLDAVSVEIVP